MNPQSQKQQILTQLKAMAYDKIAAKEQAERELIQINDQIRAVASQPEVPHQAPLADPAPSTDESAASENGSSEKPAENQPAGKDAITEPDDADGQDENQQKPADAA